MEHKPRGHLTRWTINGMPRWVLFRAGQSPHAFPIGMHREDIQLKLAEIGLKLSPDDTVEGDVANDHGDDAVRDQTLAAE